MHAKHLLTALLILSALCVLCGCNDSLRFAPSESQKQTAELTHQAAVLVNETGAAPKTEPTMRLVRGTQAALAYIGRPKVPPDPLEFDSSVSQAQTDSAKRPTAQDVFAAADQGLSLAAQLAILFGVGGAGFGGKKVVDWLAIARQKNNALQEIITGNEKFLARENQQTIEQFKNAQAKQSPATRRLVTELKS